MIIAYSAPAKVILSGEHAVVYGKPGLVSAIDLRLIFSLWEKQKSSRTRSKISDQKMLRQVQHNRETDDAITFFTKQVRGCLKTKKIDFSEKLFDYEINSEIPIARGLGSSAALAVAASAALLEFYTSQQSTKEIVNNLAYQGEKFFHKNPSGVDVSASCFGGLIFYRKEFEFLKNISSLSFKIPNKIERNLYLIDSGKPEESTAEMVQFVGKSYNKKPLLIEEIFANIEKVTKKMAISLVKEDTDFFKKNIVDNQVLLEMLGVVSKKTKNLLNKLIQFGVGKITGAGGKKSGSGFILFFSDKNKQLESYLKTKKINYFKLKQDFNGLLP